MPKLSNLPSPWCLALLFALACSGGADDADRPPVLLVIVDTLRADALGSYGNELGLSPNLDRLAQQSTRFARCFAQAPNTATSHATLFTGLYPWSHRVANLTSLERGTPGLPPVFETLAERFAAAGYRTAAFTDGGPLGRIWNLCQGFEVLEGRYEGVTAKVDQALEWLQTSEDERPTFLLLHTYQVHLPYVAPPEWVARFAGDYTGPLNEAIADIRAAREAGGEAQPDGQRLLRDREEFVERDWEQLRALYGAEVAFTDHELGRLLAETETGGELEGAIVAITSDHGEEFGEHGEWGHHQLHTETLHVPLLIRLRGELAGGKVIEEPVGLIDLFATLLDVANLPPAEVSDSRSLRPLFTGGRRSELPLFAETTEHLYSERSIPWRRSVRVGNTVYLSSLDDPSDPASETVRLFDGSSDPTEGENLLTAGGASGSARGRAERAEALIEEHLREAVERRLELLDGRSASHVLPPDESLERELKALGYTGE